MLSSERLQEIRLIRESVGAIVPKDNLARVRGLRWQEPGFDRAVWRQMCELGWAGLRVPQDRGGLGLGIVEFCMVAQELGAGLVPEPFIALAAAPLLDDETLAAVLEGSTIVVLATQETSGVVAPGTKVRFQDGAVSGAKHFVPNALGADAFIVTTDAGAVLVRRDAPGMTATSVGCQDGTFLATVVCDKAPATKLSGDYSAVHEEMALAQAFYLLGAMEKGFDITLDYVKGRK